MAFSSMRYPLVLGLGSLLAAGCVGNAGAPGSPTVSHPRIAGTIFTIVLENHDQGQVLNDSMPFFLSLAQANGSADAYLGSVHPSLPNYLQLTSGSTQGVGDDRGPSAHRITAASIADQMDTAGVPWRAYMESMSSPCNTDDLGSYAVKHDPFVYYTSIGSNPTRCREHVVDFDADFAQDLASGTYRYMWITPNLEHDMHDGSAADADAWLARIVPQIEASPGYQAGGVLFILFDEGPVSLNYLLGTPQNLAAVVVSPRLVSAGFHSGTAYDHRSYLATVEDILGLPRLATTADATPMSDFFAEGE